MPLNTKGNTRYYQDGRGHGGLRYCGIDFFFRAVFRYMILLCDVAVSSRLAVCGFSCFWLTVFGKRRSFSALWYCSFALSFLMQVNILKT